MGWIAKLLGGFIFALWKVCFPNKSNDERLGKAEEQVEILEAREEARKAMDLAEYPHTDEELDRTLREGKF